MKIFSHLVSISILFAIIAFLVNCDEQNLQKHSISNFSFSYGAIIRGDTTKQTLALVFTGDQFADGAEYIRQTLAQYNIQASFFLTGNCYRNQKFTQIICNLRSNGHYLGGHSDKHLLYCPWHNRDSLLITKSEFVADLNKNYQEMSKFGISRNEAKYFLPPFEWYNDSIAAWTKDLGSILINYTPGTKSHADYTTPDMGERYLSSEKILNSIIKFENMSPHGLKGFILLSHIGTHPSRMDKFYLCLEQLIKYLLTKGYHFVRIDELLQI
jgi:endoglucanase